METKILTIFVLCVVVVVVQCETENGLYNFSIDDLRNKTEDLTIMKWFGKLFDHHDWTLRHLNNTHIGEPCRLDIANYLTNLHNGAVWALKMNDASGRYNGHFLFGNEFWVGSKTACEDLQNERYNDIIPPFRVHFSVAKLRIHLDQFAPQIRLVLMGICVPRSCNSKEIKTLLKEHISDTINNIQTATLEVLNVRTLPEKFNVFEHWTFFLSIISASIVGLLMIIASGYEWHLNKKIKQSLMHLKKDDNALETNGNCNEVTNHNLTIVKMQLPPTNTNGGNNGISMVASATSVNNNHVGEAVGKSTENFMEDDKKKMMKKQGLGIRLLLCFSICSNGSKILSFERPPSDAISCIHGLRFLSLGWVIMVHTYLNVFQFANNKGLRSITERNFLFQTVSNATFSVDSFFFISGLLLSILYYRNEEKKQEKLRSSSNNYHIPTSTIKENDSIQKCFHMHTLKFANLLFYRFIRLTPAYMFILCVNDIIFKYVVHDTVFDVGVVQNLVNCDRYWWRNVLYINNLYPLSEMCMIWTWYMANDTQFYAIGIILLFVSLKSMKLAFGMLLTFLVTAWITTFTISNYFNYHARVEAPFALFDELYDKPWTRIGPYLVGMVTGWILFKIKLKMTIPRTINAICWAASILTLLSLVYGLGKTGLHPPYSSLYVSLGHTAWAIALAWITVACSTGYGGPVNSFLSFRGMLPLSRLTYCAYLIHPIVLSFSSHLRDGPIHLHNITVFILVCGNAAISLVLSLVVSLAFEAPAVRILQIFTKK